MGSYFGMKVGVDVGLWGLRSGFKTRVEVRFLGSGWVLGRRSEWGSGLCIRVRVGFEF